MISWCFTKSVTTKATISLPTAYTTNYSVLTTDQHYKDPGTSWKLYDQAYVYNSKTVTSFVVTSNSTSSDAFTYVTIGY